MSKYNPENSNPNFVNDDDTNSENLDYDQVKEGDPKSADTSNRSISKGRNSSTKHKPHHSRPISKSDGKDITSALIRLIVTQEGLIKNLESNSEKLSKVEENVNYLHQEFVGMKVKLDNTEQRVAEVHSIVFGDRYNRSDSLLVNAARGKDARGVLKFVGAGFLGGIITAIINFFIK